MEKYGRLFAKLEYLRNCANYKLNSSLVINQHLIELSLNDYYTNYAHLFNKISSAQPILVSNDLLKSYIDPLVNVNFPSETYIKDPEGIVIFSSYILWESVYDICISTAHNVVFLTQIDFVSEIRLIDVAYIANLARDRFFS